ncbi:MAG: histidine kinase N-terminal 7TM domain-containing protein [Bacteroidota bacterium]
MGWHYTPYGLPYIISGLVALPVAVAIWKRRSVPGALPLSIFMFAMVEWSLGNALEMFRTDLAGKTFWASVEWIGTVTIPVAWLAVAIQFSGRGEWLSRRNVALLLVVPATILVLMWTNDLHGLMRHNVRLDTSGPFSVITKDYEPAFWAYVVYAYTLLFIGSTMMMRSLFGRSRLYSGQAVMFAIGVVVPWVSNALYISGNSPVPRLDITPIAFTVSGLATSIGLLRYRLMDIVPIAWATVAGGMRSGVIVVDSQDRVVDVNPAAVRITGWSAALAIGQPVVEMLRPWPAAANACREHEIAASGKGARQSEVVQEVAGGDRSGDRSYEFRFSPLLTARGRAVGRLVVIDDITERKRVRDQLVTQQRALAAMEERERLARDLHDSLGQVLGFLNVQAQAAREQLSRGKTSLADGYLETIVTVAQDAYEEVRENIRTMKGVLPADWRFAPTLERLARRFERGYGIQTDLAIPDEIRDGVLGRAAEVQVLRIIQEAMTNARRHGGARHIQVSFAVAAEGVEVVVKDDGSGFEIEGLSGGNGRVREQDGVRTDAGYGLGIMRERAEQVGGRLEVRSAPGMGTQVRVRVPLRENEEKAQGRDADEDSGR